MVYPSKNGVMKKVSLIVDVIVLIICIAIACLVIYIL